MERIKGFLENCPEDLWKILITAGKAAVEAGTYIRDQYGQPHQVKHKGEIDLVTEVDTAAEKIICQRLSQYFPDIPFMAEESSRSSDRIPEGAVWIIDPLDGTTNFAHAFPWFAVSIAYAEEGRIRSGVIYHPLRDEFFYAASGFGAWLNGERIRVSDSPDLSGSLLATGFPYSIQDDVQQVLGAMEAILTRCQGVRRAGAAALDLAYLACGRLDGFWEIKLKPWDTAAGLLLVEEAGGMVTDFTGSPYSPTVPEIAASNGHIHQEMVQHLSPFSIIR
ncbi:inositol monophosphatase family protein [Thermodesulfobacteriota bacterium]